MSEFGQTRKSSWPTPTSALPLKADSGRTSHHVRFVPIVLQKSFWTDQRNFLGPLMRFARGDVRDHIVLAKIDHGPSYPRQRPLQRWTRRKIIFREILGVVRFSTFATVSANKRLMHRSNLTVYSITSSARPSNESGTVISSAFAAFRLIVNSTLLTCWTGRSAGFSPLRMRPV
jgi:hypothetical protein